MAAEFHVSETPSGRVTDPKKLAAIKKVLSLPEHTGGPMHPHTAALHCADTHMHCDFEHLGRNAGCDALLAAVDKQHLVARQHSMAGCAPLIASCSPAVP